MNIPYIRAPHTEGVSHPVLPSNSPNAALLIDFDNVTMGMRSDLSKELKTLLQSDVIRGKVTVQRAYADWRRYPQYIVPLSEASVDLIFAPAYGSSKKNATDIRMAIDGMELVFTRPEIGTYILLTGDSDFSSLVLKLKEYGKYVIGVGIQESSSDILVQNCDEYYSYTTLSGLRKAGTGEALSQQDPWTLVQRAVEQMTKRRDVMRSDRLKQVMLDLDSTFDEKAIGFSKFSRFLTEAAQKGLLELKKLDNGQYEVANGRSAASTASSSSPPAGSSGSSGSSSAGRRDRDGRDSRGGRGRDRDAPRRDRGESTEAPASAPAAPETSGAEDAPSTGSTSQASGGPQGSDPQTAKLRSAYELMVQAIRDLADAEGEAVRDSDVKRRMLAIQDNFDESELGFGKFSLFLKQADEHEVIQLTRGENGIYEVKVRKGAEALTASDAGMTTQARGDGADRGKDQNRGHDSGTGASKAGARAPKPDTSDDNEGRRLRPRLSARRRGASDEPPPLLEGQAVTVAGSSSQEETEARSTEDAAEDRKSGEGKQEKAPPRRGRTPRGRGSKAAAEAGSATTVDEKAPRAGKSARPASDLPQLGLPSDTESIRQYLMNSYKGVGKKTADTLIEAHEENLFEVMESQPDMIRSLLPAARAEKLLEQWVDDVARRRAEAHGPAGRPAQEATPRRRSTGGGRRRGSGGRSSR